jgi:molybdopterin-guanine dinucleotide biosynthesis protein A
MATGSVPVTGVILAGGQGRRMGGSDKGLVEVEGWPLIDHVIAALAPQVQQLLINANRNIEAYERYGHPVVPDELPGFQGPLAGMLAGLRNATNTYVVFVPCDALS